MWLYLCSSVQNVCVGTGTQPGQEVDPLLPHPVHQPLGHNDLKHNLLLLILWLISSTLDQATIIFQLHNGNCLPPLPPTSTPQVTNLKSGVSLQIHFSVSYTHLKIHGLGAPGWLSD